MGARAKTFNASGIAPGGRLFAGDLNLIQDIKADSSDFSQTIDLSSLRVGDSSIQLLKYGTAEARITAALRTDGLLRGLGGIISGAFTTIQRNAIPLSSGLAPYGTIILNTTNNQYEWNSGTDAARVWLPFISVAAATLPPGSVHAWMSAAAPAGYLLCDGAAVSRSTYAALFAEISVTYGPGNGSTTFNVPDMQGRMLVGKGTHADIDALGENEGLGIGSRRPKHKHSISQATYALQDFAPGSDVGRLRQDTGSSGGVSGPTGAGATVGPQTGSEPTDSPAYLTVNYIIKT